MMGAAAAALAAVLLCLDPAASPAAAQVAAPPHTEADAQFMVAMIAHHGQAVEMGRLAPERTTTPSILTLAARIVNGQTDEIATMRRWLSDRGFAETAADEHAGHHAGHAMPVPADHAAHQGMPGMLSPEQMQALAQARGIAFDRLFLEMMIQHHRGAVVMVDTLFAAPGAAQDNTVFKFASDVQVDQRTEIARMERMLGASIVEDLVL